VTRSRVVNTRDAERWQYQSGKCGESGAAAATGGTGRSATSPPVMPALVAGIHVFLSGLSKQGVDGRDKPGHDCGKLVHMIGTPAKRFAVSHPTHSPLAEMGRVG